MPLSGACSGNELPGSGTRVGARWERRQGAIAASRVGQKWGRREGLRWPSTGVIMPTRAPGIPATQAFQHTLSPGRHCCGPGCRGFESPRSPPSKVALTSGFTSLLPRAGPAGSSEWGKRRHPAPVAGPLSCANAKVEWGKTALVAPTILRCTNALQPQGAGPPADHAPDYRAFVCDGHHPHWSNGGLSFSYADGVNRRLEGTQPISLVTGSGQRSRRIFAALLIQT